MWAKTSLYHRQEAYFVTVLSQDAPLLLFFGDYYGHLCAYPLTGKIKCHIIMENGSLLTYHKEQNYENYHHYIKPRL